MDGWIDCRGIDNWIDAWMDYSGIDKWMNKCIHEQIGVWINK